jgi:23S rRNA pseudouridine2605 synthase
MKLNAYVAHAGITSRRKAVELIKSGSVTVNGVAHRDPSYNVTLIDRVSVFGRSIKAEENIYILLNKPKGYVTTTYDELGRQTVLDLIDPSIKVRLYPIGRLDKDTTGALLLTNDGQMAQTLVHPRYGVQKTYKVTLNRDLADESLEQIKKGVYLDDGKATVDEITFCSPLCRLTVHVIIHSGKKRIIRRLFKQLGYFVDKLDRINFSGLTLRGLPRGGWRYLTKQEIARLKKESR